MCVTLSPSGTVTLSYDYRLHGRRETLTSGRYGPSGISLAIAREVLLEAHKSVQACISPVLEKQREKWRGGGRHQDLRRGDVSTAGQCAVESASTSSFPPLRCSTGKCRGGVRHMDRSLLWLSYKHVYYGSMEALLSAF